MKEIETKYHVRTRPISLIYLVLRSDALKEIAVILYFNSCANYC